MSYLKKITRPTLLIDEARVRENISRMAEKADRSRVRFRPHFKTHQSVEIGRWFRDAGVTAITVSSLEMARYFAGDGWQDITVAFPVNVREAETINALAASCTLGVLVESREAVRLLGARLRAPVDTWIKIDVGTGRTGIPWDQALNVIAVAEEILAGKFLTFRGLLSHAGHTYKAKNRAEIQAIYATTLARLQDLQATLQETVDDKVEISVGDTPACTIVEDYGAVDEIRPGNFVFYDVQQLAAGLCSEQEIGIALAAPVVARHRDRNVVVVYGGAVHLSKDYVSRPDGSVLYGLIAPLSESGWGPSIADSYVASVSQEHGVIQTTAEVVDRLKIGDVVAILPAHSCLTANLMKRYLALDGRIIPMGEFY